METLASLDQMVQLGSVSSHRAPTVCPAPVGASTVCWAQHKLLLCARPEGTLLLCVKFSTGSYCVSVPSYVLGPAQAPTVSRAQQSSHCVQGPAQAPTVCRAQHKLPLCAGLSTSSYNVAGPSRKQACCWGRSLQFGDTPLPVTWEAPGRGGPEEAARPPGRRKGRGAKDCGGNPGSCLLPSCPREAVLVTTTGRVLPFAGL